jgi:hypothetical protein
VYAILSMHCIVFTRLPQVLISVMISHLPSFTLGQCIQEQSNLQAFMTSTHSVNGPQMSDNPYESMHVLSQTTFSMQLPTLHDVAVFPLDFFTTTVDTPPQPTLLQTSPVALRNDSIAPLHTDILHSHIEWLNHQDETEYDPTPSSDADSPWTVSKHRYSTRIHPSGHTTNATQPHVKSTIPCSHNLYSALTHMCALVEPIHVLNCYKNEK